MVLKFLLPRPYRLPIRTPFIPLFTAAALAVAAPVLDNLGICVGLAIFINLSILRNSFCCVSNNCLSFDIFSFPPLPFSVLLRLSIKESKSSMSPFCNFLASFRATIDSVTSVSVCLISSCIDLYFSCNVS